MKTQARMVNKATSSSKLRTILGESRNTPKSTPTDTRLSSDEERAIREAKQYIYENEKSELRYFTENDK